MLQNRVAVCFRFLLLLLLFLAAAVSAMDAVTEAWANRVIPLPKQINVAGSRVLSKDEITLCPTDSDDGRIATAIETVQPFAGGDQGFTIKLILTHDRKNCPAKLAKALAKLANRDQAYAIEPVMTSGAFSGFLLVANEPLGLLYAARTLHQLLKPSLNHRHIEIPQVTIIDWPDLEERGEWGWNLSHDRYSIAELKMNEIEMHATLGFQADGSPSATLDRAFLSQSKRLGVKVVPIIRHLEQLAVTGLFTYHPNTAATPEPNKPLPSDYQPAVCFSNPASIDLIAGWMSQLLAYEEVHDINAWLAESPSPCFCELCRGHNSFELQTKSLLRAFAIAGADHPDAHLRILLSQASYMDNDKVLASITPETRITYYSGQTTYDSSHEPMIYPLLESFARSGHWLSVYPQLTNSWRSIFPFTGPHFIKARMTEFVEKGLHGFSGYATPANGYYDFNIAAAAEWSWNSCGRSARQFAEAYATRLRFKQPRLFAEWADLIGRTGWHLAGSRTVESLIFAAGGQVFIDGFIEDGVLFSTEKPIEYGKGILAEFPNEASLDHHLASAQQALELAQRADEPLMLLESHCVLHTLLFVKELKSIVDAFQQPLSATRTKTIQQQLDAVDVTAQNLTAAMIGWGNLVHPVEQEALHYRFRDSVDFAATIAGRLRTWAEECQIVDPLPAYRFNRIAAWQTEDFAETADVALWADITEHVPQAGAYDIRLFFLNGASGVDTRAVTLLCGPTKESAQPVFVDRWDGRLSKYGRYLEYWLAIPKKPNNLAHALDRYFIKAELSGPALDLPQPRRTSQGELLIRKSWRDAKVNRSIH